MITVTYKYCPSPLLSPRHASPSSSFIATLPTKAAFITLPSMSPHGSSNGEFTLSFSRHQYIILTLFHVCFVIGFAFVYSWLLPAFPEFTNQPRSKDKDYAIVALLALNITIVGHGIMFVVSLYRLYKFQPRGYRNPFNTLGFILGSIMLGFDIFLVSQFPRWHGQFKAAGDSRSAQYCTSATVLYAIHLPCALFCSSFFLYRHFYYEDVIAHESGETDNGENGERRFRR